MTKEEWIAGRIAYLEGKTLPGSLVPELSIDLIARMLDSAWNRGFSEGVRSYANKSDLGQSE